VLQAVQRPPGSFIVRERSRQSRQPTAHIPVWIGRETPELRSHLLDGNAALPRHDRQILANGGGGFRGPAIHVSQRPRFTVVRRQPGVPDGCDAF
jgi:hypothetical protein